MRKRSRVKRHAVTQPLDKPYRFIPLTQEQNAIVDIGDFKWLSQWNWTANWNKGTHSFYVTRGIYENGKTRTIKMHRVILGCESGEEGDHKNHDTLDNRRENLRKCNNVQNRQNVRKQKNNTSGYKGVYLYKATGRWWAEIMSSGKKFYLGYFPTAKEAACAYDAAAKIRHGEFAQLNFP